jgi:hypothetical protein
MTREGRPIGIKKVEACILLRGMVTAGDQEAEPKKKRPGVWHFDTILSEPCFRVGDDLSEGVAMEKGGTGLATVKCGIKWETETHEYRVGLSKSHLIDVVHPRMLRGSPCRHAALAFNSRRLALTVASRTDRDRSSE